MEVRFTTLTAVEDSVNICGQLLCMISAKLLISHHAGHFYNNHHVLAAAVG